MSHSQGVAYHMLTVEGSHSEMPDLQVGESKEKTSRTKDSGKNSVKAPKPRSKARSQARERSRQSKAKAMSSDPQDFINKGY